jgi:hypothetical protein
VALNAIEIPLELVVAPDATPWALPSVADVTSVTGTVVSTVTESAADATEVLLAASVAFAVML